VGNHSKQEIERYYFNLFKDHYPVPSGTVDYGDKPDVIVHGARRVGIEIANLYLSDGTDPNSEQVQRRRRAKVLRLAQAEYLGAGGKRIEFTFQFNPSKPIADERAVATALAKLAFALEKLPAGSVSRHHFGDVPEVWFIYHNPIEYADARWTSSQGYFGQTLSVQRVRELIEVKSQKVRGYRPCDAYWLLMVVDFMDSAQDQEIDWPASGGSVRSPFERIILYKPQFASCVEVPKDQ